MPSKIEWTGETWNPVTGCTRASKGCDNCYAVTMSARLEHMGQTKYSGLTVVNGKGDRHFNGTIRTHDDELLKPLRWKKPRTIFVNSMSDTFHRDVPFEFIDRMFAVMALCPQHTFQVLTKRPERMAEYLNDLYAAKRNVIDSLAFVRPDLTLGEREAAMSRAFDGDSGRWLEKRKGDPLPNVWIGTTTEDQEAADARIPHLLRCPAAVRFLSVEPMVGPVELAHWVGSDRWHGPALTDDWATFVWPEWVPAKLREHIESFWSAASYRSPRKWAESFVRTSMRSHVGTPAFGTRVGVSERSWIVLPTDPAAVEFGRIVPCWNNIVAIVRDDGTFRMGIGCDGGPGWLSRWLAPDGEYRHRLHWVICGGESGKGARPMHPDWARSLRDQCATRGVPFFFKQVGACVYKGEWPNFQSWVDRATRDIGPASGVRSPVCMDAKARPCKIGRDFMVARDEGEFPVAFFDRVGKHQAGRLLDGVTLDGMPGVRS